VQVVQVVALPGPAGRRGRLAAVAVVQDYQVALGDIHTAAAPEQQVA